MATAPNERAVELADWVVRHVHIIGEQAAGIDLSGHNVTVASYGAGFKVLYEIHTAGLRGTHRRSFEHICNDEHEAGVYLARLERRWA